MKETKEFQQPSTHDSKWFPLITINQTEDYITKRKKQNRNIIFIINSVARLTTYIGT